jgi:hypothetical protein
MANSMNDLHFRRPRRASVWPLAMLVLVLAASVSSATRINGPGDPALFGATIVDFDAETPDSYFTSQDLGGFTVTAAAGELHIDVEWCDDFGTTGNCLDTLDLGGQPNDDFSVVFTDTVSAFGFVLNALDIDWTVEVYNEAGGLLNSYAITSQSPGLSGFARRGYFGATESEDIKSFTVSSAGSDRALIDDFAFMSATPVPEPGPLVLLTLGLVGLGAGVQRTR